MAVTANDNGISIRLGVPPNAIVASTTLNNGAVFKLQSYGAGSIALGTSALGVGATTAITLDFELPALPLQIGNYPNNVTRGFQLTDATLYYQFVGSSGNTSAGASTMTFNAFTQSYVDQSATLLNSSGSSGSSGVPYGGTFTFSGGINGTSSAMTLAASSTINVVVCSPQSSLAPMVNTNNQRMVFEWAYNSGTATSFVAIVYGADIHGNWIAV